MSRFPYEKPINLIVACSENRVIGRNGRLPWNIQEDQAWFHDWTRHQILVMGRICYESWPKVHADGRKPIVITSKSRDELKQMPMPKDGNEPLVAGSVAEAINLAQGLAGDIFVCGGHRIFEETLPLAKYLYMTEVHATVEGDVYFPEWKSLGWRAQYTYASRDDHYKYTFSILERLGKKGVSKTH